MKSAKILKNFFLDFESRKALFSFLNTPIGKDFLKGCIDVLTIEICSKAFEFVCSLFVDIEGKKDKLP